jgi:exopolysaccharide production protein ExoZ
MAKPSYPSLDIIRFSAALMVTLFHLSYHSWHNSTTASAIYLEKDLLVIGRFFKSGYVGVPIFFVLSGFVIAISANDKCVFAFLRSRFLRLYPSAWICATITLLVLVGDPEWVRKYSHSMSLWPAAPWVDPVYWTLAVELTFYALVAIMLSVVGSKYLAVFGYVLGLSSSAFWLARAGDFAFGKPFGGFFMYLELQIGNLVVAGCYFGLGIMIWSLAVQGFGKLRISTAIVCLVAGVIATLSSARFKCIDEDGPIRDVAVVPLIWLFAVGCIAISAYWSETISLRLARFSSPLRTAGLVTYPLYLVHQVLGIAIMDATSALVGGIMSLIIALCSVLIIAWSAVRLERYPRLGISHFLDLLSAACFTRYPEADCHR